MLSHNFRKAADSSSPKYRAGDAARRIAVCLRSHCGTVAAQTQESLTHKHRSICRTNEETTDTQIQEHLSHKHRNG